MIKVLFFAKLREQLDCEQVELNVEHSLSVAQLCQQLAERGDVWQQQMQMNKLFAAVNQNMANAETMINNGDEVAFFPPVTGG